MRNAVINKITEAASSNKNIFVITGDCGFSVFDEYRRRFSKRFLNLGIAEQNTISFAAGLALTGYKVFVYNIAPFVLYRCFEQVRNDICYQELAVTLIGVGSGVTYAPQGVTHYSVEDIAIARALPNLTILSPSDPLEAQCCAEYAIRSDKPVYIRVAKSGEPPIHSAKPASIVKPIIMKNGEAVAILFHGSVGIEVMKAVEGLKKTPMVISVPMLQPLNFDFLKKMFKKIRTVITVEEHFVEGGLGSILAERIAKECLPLRLKNLGLNNEFIHDIKNNSGMRNKYGISADKIKEVILKEF